MLGAQQPILRATELLNCLPNYLPLTGKRIIFFNLNKYNRNGEKKIENVLSAHIMEIFKSFIFATDKIGYLMANGIL